MLMFGGRTLVCQTDAACLGFPVGSTDFRVNADSGLDPNMTCYKGGETVNQNFQMCDVTSMSHVNICRRS